MRIELLHFEGCPGSTRTLSILEKVLAEEGLTAEVVPVVPGPDARPYFPGSPTILVDGEDLFPIEHRDPGSAVSCRIYATPEGPKNHPSASLVRAALAGRFAPGSRESGVVFFSTPGSPWPDPVFCTNPY